MPAPLITSENAREMQARSAEAKRKKREEAEKLAAEHQEAILGGALALHEALLGDPEARAQAAPLIREAYDRYLGRPTEKSEVEHSGQVEIVVRSMFDEPTDPGSAGESDPETE
jgi:exopolyphosphatase/pppGpp-phosphohydrolase